MTPPHILNKIRAAQTNQTKELDLSGKKLTRIPPEVFNLTQLEKLDLGYNEITEIPAKIGSLSQLHCLIVAYNPLQRIGDACGLFLDLEQYTRLSQAIRPEQVAGIVCTYPHDIPKEIPAELLRCQNLAIWVRNISKSAPVLDWLRQLTNITELSLSGSRLTTLSDELSYLTKLTSLNLSGTNLTRLPDSLKHQLFSQISSSLPRFRLLFNYYLIFILTFSSL